MKKWLLLISFCVCISLAYAEEKSPFRSTHFWNQSAITVEDDQDSQQCQAVRILPKWYLTAAHCVYPMCKEECTVYIKLLEGDLQAIARVEHSTAEPTVFWQDYNPNSLRDVRQDMALIRFDQEKADFSFRHVSKRKNLEQAEFLQMLKTNPYQVQREQWDSLHQARPKLLLVGDVFSRRLTKPIAVPDLRPSRFEAQQMKQGDVSYVYSDVENFYYFTELKHYLGTNFGVYKGMSGSGVVLPGGEIIGIVSANLFNEGQLFAYDNDDNPLYSIPYSHNYFMFVPFSEANRTFISATVFDGRFRDTGYGPNFSSHIDRYSVKTDENLRSAFPGMNMNNASLAK